MLLRNKMDADDISQEVLIRIWENMDQFNILSAASWIMKTTHNLCIDYLRKRKRNFTRELEISDEIAETVKDNCNASNPFAAAHMNDISQKVEEAIERLPENLRSVFVMYEINEMKYVEISKALDLPLNSVKVYLLRARKRLQEDLKCCEVQELF